MKKQDYGRPYRRAAFRGNHLMFALLIVSVLMGTAVEIAVAILLQRAIDTATGIGDYTILELVEQCLAVMAGYLLGDFCYRECTSRFMRRVNRQYRGKLFEDLIRKNITAFSREQTSTYISMLTADANTVEENYFLNMQMLATNAFRLVSSLILMFYYNWFLAVVSLILTGMVLYCSMALGGRMEKTQKTVSDRSAGFVGQVKDLLTGFCVVKSFQAEKETMKMYGEKNNQLEQAKFFNRRLQYLADTLAGFASFTMQMAVFLLGAFMAIRGYITVGVIIVFTQLTGQVANAVANLARRVGVYKAARSLMDKAGETLLANTNEKEGKPITAIGEGIACENLRFGYEENNEILKGVSLSMEAGKSYALVGASGSGKSTLLNLLLGSYPEYLGSITVGGEELKEISTESLYDLISLVQQNVFVFDSTIEENITMFKSFPEAAVADAICRSGLTELIEEKGRDYRCGENGCNLSGGERQRISIARCLLKNTKVLMMDEATAALDAQTSANVTNAILDVEDLTRIIVTHKLEAGILERFDEILVLRDGRIEEKGTFRQLLEQNGYFSALYKVSAGA